MPYGHNRARAGGIPLSPRHGVNPSMLQCTLCGDHYGVALVGRIRSTDGYDTGMPAPAVIARGHCDECTHLQTVGILVIITRDGDHRSRTGHKAVITPAAASEIAGSIAGTEHDWTKVRAFLIEETAARMCGLLQIIEKRASDGLNGEFTPTED